MTATLSRRQILAAGAISAAAFPMIGMSTFAVAADQPKFSKRTMGLMEQSVVIDMLSSLSLGGMFKIAGGRLSDDLRQFFRKSGITVFHNSRNLWGEFDEAPIKGMEWMAQWNGFIARNADLFMAVDKAGDIAKAKAQGKIAILMGLQTSDHFRKVEDVDNFFQIGQRVSQLTYNTQNLIGSGSTERVDGGVSDFGAAIIKRMNEVGMMVDVSHCAGRTTLDGIALSTKPIAITHSNCAAINPHPRAKSDEAIKALAAKGGVMGVTGVAPFLTSEPNPTVMNVVDHIDHIVKLVGIDHAGIGSDGTLYGYDSASPEDIALRNSRYKASYRLGDKLDIPDFVGPYKFYHLTEALISRGYSDDNIKQILGGNFERLGREIWG